MRRQRTRGRTSTFARAAVAAALVVPLLATAACGEPAPAAKGTPPPVRIGAIYNLTGDQSSLDAPSLDGARLAVERINAHGGLLGRRVELLERDGQTSEATVQRAAASLVASGVSAIVGLSDTDQVLAAAPIAARAGVPFVTSGATSPLLAKQVPEWLFLACFGDNAQAAANAQYAIDRLGARTAAVLYDKDMDYARLLAKYFERSLRAQGGRILVSASYEKASHAARRLTEGGSSRQSGSGEEGEEDGSGSGEQTSPATPAPGPGKADQAATADVLYVAAGPEDAPRIVRALRAAGYRQPIMGGDSFDSAALISAAEKSGGKVYYTTHSAVGMDSASKAVRRFDASFHAAYGHSPQNAFAGLGYDAVGLVASAIKRADSAKPSEVRDAIQATRRYPGVTGTLSFGDEGSLPRKKVTVVCVGRRPVVVAQFTPGFVARP